MANSWYRIENGELQLQKKYVDGIKEEMKDGFLEFPLKCHLSYWNKQLTSTPAARYGYYPRPPTTPLNTDEIVSRKIEVAGYMEETKCLPFPPDNLLLKPYCLLIAPPVVAYLDDLADYQSTLRAAISVFQQLNGLIFEGKRIKVTMSSEVSMTDPEADLWSLIWLKTSLIKKRY